MTNPYYQNKAYLRDEQYRDSRNLDARAALHRDFSTNPEAWQAWVFTQMALRPGQTVLECGCGPGWLWRENLARIPAGCHIVLTDLSPGMVAEAEAALGDSGHDFSFQVASVEQLPFADGSFDVVVANHMLYHVPDLAAGLAEIRRVLPGNGRLLAATNGENHMRQMKELAQRALPERVAHQWPQLAFRLENGRELLAPYFSQIECYPYPDSLAVTKAQPLLAYLTSLSDPTTALTAEQLAAIQQHISATIASLGAYTIEKESALFIAQ